MLSPSRRAAEAAPRRAASRPTAASFYALVGITSVAVLVTALCGGLALWAEDQYLDQPDADMASTGQGLTLSAWAFGGFSIVGGAATIALGVLRYSHRAERAEAAAPAE